MEMDSLIRSAARAMVAAALVIVLPAPAPAPAAAGSDATLVRTDVGRVRGTVSGAYRLFQGIPFAAAPVGPLRVEASYPLSAYRSTRHALAAIVSDREWAWPAEETDDLFARHVPTYSYEFTDRRAASLFEYPADIPAGASHGAELGYLFDHLGKPDDLDRAQRALADRMIRYWARFAGTGDPNRPGLPRWPRHRHHHAAPHVQQLGPDRTGAFDRSGEHQLRFWRDLG
jgi:carboxylesterase type B